MAITNAQQYQQLVNKPANGKRPGYRGDAAYGRSSRSSQATSIGQARGATGSGGGASLGGGRDRDEKPAQQIISGKSYDVTPETKAQRDMLFEIANEEKQTLKDDFINKPANYNKYTPGYLKFIADINRKPNRKFFIDRVLKAGKIPNYADLYDEDFNIEEAYKNYMDNRLAGKTDAMGNPVQGFSYGDDGMLTGNFIDSGGNNNYVPPIIPEDDTTEEDPTVPRNLGGLAPRFMGSSFDFTGLADGGRAGYMDGGMMEDTPEGGIMDLESGRQMYFLGKLVKKATRAVKKITKSPFGKAALGAALFKFGGGFGGGKGLASFFGKGSFNPLRMAAQATADGPMTQLSPLGKILSKFGMATGEDGGKLTLGGKLGLGIGVPMALDALGVGKEEEDGFDIDEYYKTQGIDIDAIRNNPNRILARRFMAEGGNAEPVAKKTMPLLDMDGKEMDLRAEGGFVPLGRMERADDVPARLSKNEFVFTADAVRNAGEGDIDKGAEVMYNMMKNLESGGEVSEESQGLDGAREMFKTSQRLEEVL